ncbi:MAG TPA: hypothetical protein VEU51_16915, partial [Candidatus Acidoferrales bacterium]|nr:hypothetical protein [Candidatus Acidoferrales bacterium]
YLTHAPIEAANRIRAEHDLNPDSIDAVEVRVAPGALGVCNIQEPRTGLEGKFSLRSTAAMALSGIDTSSLQTFTDARVTEPGLVHLRDRVRIVADEKLGGTQSTVVVESRGRRWQSSADSGVPAPDLAAQRASLLRKFNAIVAPVIGERNAQRLADAALHADENISASELMKLTRAA